jgi:hypothetical protein
LTVRCFRNDCRPDRQCPARGQAGGGSQARVRGGCRPRRECPADDRTPAARRTGGDPSGSPGGHDNSCGARPDATPESAAAAGSGRLKCVECGRCVAGMVPYAAPERRAILPQTLPDTSTTAVRQAVQPDTRRRTAASGCPSDGSGGYRNRSPGRRPLVGCSQRRWAVEPGGQPAADLAADIGHRRPGERAGLLEAEIVDLQPSDLTGLSAADDRLGDVVGVDADLGPGVGGRGA